MELSKSEFDVLVALKLDFPQTQRDIARSRHLSLGAVNRAYRSLQEAGLINAFQLTPAGEKQLSTYRVDNAIIMAAGLSSRFAPISYERPKGVLMVRGEVLIERQIRQLQQAGITDITVVVGYMKESFFYLEDLFGVKIRVNEEYRQRNNNSTLMLVRNQLGNTYICSSDDYFTENVFEPYVYRAYYAGVYQDSPTDEYVMELGPANRIRSVSIGGPYGWSMLGHAYFDRRFSKQFISILESIYRLPETAPKLWEDIYREHVKELDMVMRPYDAVVIHEFDSLAEVQAFDHDFLTNVDSAIFDHICSVLHCKREDISDIESIKQGLTNLSFRFSAQGGSYVYRHPGVGTEEIISRKSESFSQKIAADLGIDGTFIYEDPTEGWKISRYLVDCEMLDYHNHEQVAQAMQIARTLHSCGVTSDFTFNLNEKTRQTIALLDKGRAASFRDYPELVERAQRLYNVVSAQGVAPVLCHNDFYAPNFLVGKDRIDLIDWEYSGMSDYASDLGVFICCSDYSYDEAIEVLELYFERPLTPDELVHCVSYISIASFYWFVWALYKEMCGESVGEFLYLWYRYAKDYGIRAEKLIAAAKGDGGRTASKTYEK